MKEQGSGVRGQGSVKRGMIRVKDPEKTVKMEEHHQVFDRRRDEQGVMRLGLYDAKSGRVMRGVVRDETVIQDTISFLAICWEVHGLGMPNHLVMDAAKISKSIVEFLNRIGVCPLYVPPEKMALCVPLQRAFAATGETPVPPSQA